QRTDIAAVLAEPLLYQDRFLGVIAVTRREGRPFTLEDQRLVRLFAAQAAVAIENARLFAEVKRSYESLEQAQDALVRTEKLRALGQMAAGIAHDLNNMLATILGQAELLRLRNANPEVREGLSLLEMAAADGASIVRRLQDFSRQRTSTELVPLDLGAVVREALDITRARWKDEAQRGGRGIEVDVHISDVPPILGHASNIREALTNLIFNAVDAMPRGGLMSFVATSTPEGVVLRVTDTGVGMPQEVCRRVFEPFFTTKGVKGTGLGLSVVYGIMERHGGRVEVASIPGQGTTLTLHFQAAQSAESPPAAQASPIHPPRRLLLIDDDQMVRRTLASLLRAAGHTVSEAEGGVAGLARLREAPVDLVVTDLGMPEMTGWDVARAVRAHAPHLPIVLLTGWGEQVDAEIQERRLVDCILGKPIQLSHLLTRIAELAVEPPEARTHSGDRAGG
ncbi:MAG TPA: ATP-binding protein, partial [Candidatus Acidoferrum sp.]|nr:ATP-binding protein [Candidatus Acidoferrum sp.]